MNEAVEFLLPPFVMCVVLAGIHVYMGMHVLKREVIFVDLALAQMAALGTTVAQYSASHTHGHGHAHIAADNTMVMSFTFAALGAVLFAFAGTVRKYVAQEAIVGIVYAVSTAVMMLLLSKSPDGAEDMKRVFGGVLLLTEWHDVTTSALIYAAVGVALFFFRKQFHKLSWDPEGARADMKNAAIWDLAFYLLFAVVLTVSIQSAGVLLVFSFLIVPAVITQLFSERIWVRLFAGWSVGILAALFGLCLSWMGDYPAGASIIAVFGFLLILAGAVRYLLRGRFSG